MEWVIVAAVFLALAAFAGYRLWLNTNPMPSGIHIGPYVKGKSRSIGMPKRLVRNGFYFPQPSKTGGHVHAIVIPIDGMAHAGGLILKFAIGFRLGVEIVPQEYPSAPATVSLMIQRRGDNYTAEGKYENYRLYSREFLIIDRPGAYELSLTLDPENWKTIFSQDSAPHMAEVLADAQAIHICFGSEGGRSHGVYANGEAHFRLDRIQVV